MAYKAVIYKSKACVARFYFEMEQEIDLIKSSLWAINWSILESLILRNHFL